MNSEPREERDEQRRLEQQHPRFCQICRDFTDHHTDGHTSPEDVADPEFVRNAVAEARRLMEQKRRERTGT